MARRIKWGNEKERDPASNQFPKCSPLSGTHRDSQSWVDFANKGPSSQGYGFSSGHVWMCELDCEEG